MIFQQTIYGGRNLTSWKNIVEYNNSSRKQTKREIGDSVLSNCDKRIFKTKSYLVTSEKKDIQNIIDIKNFRTLKKLLKVR